MIVGTTIAAGGPLKEVGIAAVIFEMLDDERSHSGQCLSLGIVGLTCQKAVVESEKVLRHMGGIMGSHDIVPAQSADPPPFLSSSQEAAEHLTKVVL